MDLNIFMDKVSQSAFQKQVNQKMKKQNYYLINCLIAFNLLISLISYCIREKKIIKLFE